MLGIWKKVRIINEVIVMDNQSFEKEMVNIKKGYLEEDFKVFHIKDKRNLEFQYHHHDFHKITVFISGKVTYLIEGKSYKLKPWDIVLVSSDEIHKPLIDAGEIYDRVVIYINPRFIEEHSSSECDLLTCFKLAKDRNFNLLRLNSEVLINIKDILSHLEEANGNIAFGSNILKKSIMLQLMVNINRLFLGVNQNMEFNDVEYDEAIIKIINYINENISEELSIDNLSTEFFINKYYLMHKFKAQTGYSIHSYILEKRLIMANNLIRKGILAGEVCSRCGFKDYSSFVKAFKKKYGLSPKKHYKASETKQYFELE